MKQCPACDFSFPDFHLVCDFDGTDLLSIPEKPSIVAPRRSPLRRIFESPIWLISLTGLALFSSAILFGFYDAIHQPAPVVKDGSEVVVSNNTAPAASGANAPASSTEAKRSGLKRPNRVASSVGNHAHSREVAGRAKSRQPRRAPTTQSDPAETARRTPQPQVLVETKEAAVAVNNSKTASKEPQPARIPAKDSPRVSNDKDPKVVAMLKTTWRVLKKPFRF